MDKDKRCGGGVALAVSVVLHQPDRAELSRMLDSLGVALANARTVGLQRAEVLLIDHSPQAREDIVTACGGRCAKDAHIHYQHVKANPGFGAGHNRAFSACRSWADIFLVANPDLEFAPDSLAAGLGFLAEQPHVGLVAPALVEPGGRLRPACFRYPDIMTLLARLWGGNWAARRSHRYECRDWDAGNAVFNPLLISGCCMLFRTRAFAKLGGFDPNYFLYFEDFDLSLRANRMGVSAYAPNMIVKHSGGKLSRKGIRHILYYVRSAQRFFATYGLISGIWLKLE